MMAQPKREEIFEVVQACVAESLAVDESEIAMDSRLIDDLGADSLDFLDFVFSLENRFSVKLRQEGLDQLMRAEISDARLTNEGFFLPEDVEALSEWIPRLRVAEEPDKITPQSLFSYITVETLVILVEHKLSTATG